MTLRDRAIVRLRKKADLRAHLFVYALVNGALVALWATGGVHHFFWPVFPIVGWGVGLVLNFWDVYRSDALSEPSIQREMRQLERHDRLRV